MGVVEAVRRPAPPMGLPTSMAFGFDVGGVGRVCAGAEAASRAGDEQCPGPLSPRPHGNPPCRYFVAAARGPRLGRLVEQGHHVRGLNLTVIPRSRGKRLRGHGLVDVVGVRCRRRSSAPRSASCREARRPLPDGVAGVLDLGDVQGGRRPGRAMSFSSLLSSTLGGFCRPWPRRPSPRSGGRIRAVLRREVVSRTYSAVRPFGARRRSEPMAPSPSRSSGRTRARAARKARSRSAASSPPGRPPPWPRPPRCARAGRAAT